MANRFWGETPIVQYKAPSLQEAAWGPMQLKGQDDALTAQVDALNEAKLTLEAALGKSAPKQDEFNKAYQDVTVGILSQGATPSMIDKAKKAKQLYLQHVLPIQDFAKKREEYATEYAKSRLNGDNIIMGNNPLDITFDQYQKDPGSLASFQAIGRDKLTSLGMAYGKNYAEGNTGTDMSNAGLGIIGFVKGFKNSQDALKAYQSDPKFKTLVDSEVSNIAKGRGLDPAHPEVRDAITSGIMSGVVGGVERTAVPAWTQRGGGESADSQANMDFIKIQNKPISLVQGDDVLSVAAENPEKLKELDAMSKKLTGYSYHEMESKIAAEDQKWRDYVPSVMDKTGLLDPENLRLKRDQIKNALQTDPYFTNSVAIRLNKGALADLSTPVANDMQSRIKLKLEDPIHAALSTGALVDQAYSSEDRALLKKIASGDIVPESVSMEDLLYQGQMNDEVDDRGMLTRRTVGGPGKPALSFTVKYKDSNKKDAERTIVVTPNSELYHSAKSIVGLIYNQTKYPSKGDINTMNIINAFEGEQKRVLESRRQKSLQPQ